MNTISVKELVERYNKWRKAHVRTDDCFIEWLEYEIDAKGIYISTYKNPK